MIFGMTFKIIAMKLSTKGRYAVQALVDLAKHSSEIAPASITDIASRQSLSPQYLEQLFAKLRRAGIICSIRGQMGGYHLAQAAQDITIAAIIDAVDEPIRTTNCKSNSGKSCMGKTEKCMTHNLWAGMEQIIRSYLASITLYHVTEGHLDAQGHILRDAVSTMPPVVKAAP